MAKNDSRFTADIFSEFWLNGTLAAVGANYEIRRRGLAGDSEGTFDIVTGVEGTWYSLSSIRNFGVTESYPNFKYAASLVEIRRSDLPAGSSIDEHSASVYMISAVESNL
jgi:hypothetical protein